MQVGSKNFSPGRIFCIGKNYEEHIRELDEGEIRSNPGKKEHPVVFMKPATSLVAPGEVIRVPSHGKTLHHEVEVVILLHGGGKNISQDQALSCIGGVTLGLDLTLRDVQAKLKSGGHPWELSKAFDQSAPLGRMRGYDASIDLFDLPFQCLVNGDRRQEGNTRDMIFPIPRIIAFLSTVWELMPGDLVYTGTPAGIGALKGGDEVTVESPVTGKFNWKLR
ncbi:fumarylacetoacetate hydrolase [Candidatus Nitromaritima sp. SCGC AAA799-C22]|nr:fumarylacetoacetate hydrolase [Candidatus Nitromaritima sp. SCGC AAA799-C22]